MASAAAIGSNGDRLEAGAAVRGSAPHRPVPRHLAILCFVLSGFAGLVYETCWIRQASLVFGSTTLAFSTVLATFFAGLALGSWWFGKVAQRTWRPLKLYALLEIALAVVALGSPWAFALSDEVYGWIYRSWTEDPALLAGARMAVVAVLLLPPTVMMGATFPLFCRQFVVDRESIAGSIGFLYGANTLGAAAGCAATGFFLLPALGVHGSITLAATLNAIVGVIVLRLRLTAPLAATPEKAATDPASRPRSRRVALLFFAIGLVALGSQVLWARFLALLVPNTVHTYTITLTVVLVGIVLGSWVASRLFDRRLPRGPCFGALQVLTGLSLLLLMHLPPSVWRGLGSELAICALLMLPPAILSGASFPLAIRMVLDDPGAAGATAGRMTAINTIGGITGALLVGVLALPLLGVHTTLLLLSAVSLLTGAAAWIGLPGRLPWVSRRTAAVAAAAVLWFALPLLLPTRVPRDLLAPPHALLDYREGSGGSLAVVRRDGVRRLEIDRWWQGEDRVNHQIMAAHLPMLHAREDLENVLVVGYGTGQAPSRFAMYDVARLECVDIEPVIFDFVAEHFDSEWTSDPRVRLVHEDGRSYLTHGAQTYDLISIEIGQLFRPGVASFYSEDFYRRTAAKLRPGGVLAQFVPLPFLEVDALRRVVRTFVEVFPQSALWYNTAELLIVGVVDGPITIAPERLAALAANARVQQDLGYSQWGGEPYWLRRPGALLGGYLCGPTGLAALSDGAEPYSDDVPALEYATSAYDPGARHELEALALLRQHLDPIEDLVRSPVDAAVLAEARSVREKNLADLEARAHLRLGKLLRGRGELAEGEELLRLAVRTQPEDLACMRSLADAHQEAGRFEDARALYARVLEANARDALARRGLGLVFLKTGDAAAAVRELRKAADLRPDDAITHNYLGAALARAGRLDDAVPHLERALELWPEYPSATTHLDKVRAALQGR